MTIDTIDKVLIIGYLIAVFAIGIWSGRKIRSIREFAVAHRNYPAFVLFATLSASFIGGGFSFGNAAKVYEGGIGVATTLWGFSAMLLLLAVFIAPRLKQRFNLCISPGDIMEKNYGKTGKIVSGVLGMLVCMGILGAQVGAMADVFQTFLGMRREAGAYLGCAIVIVYTSFGGIKAVIFTDVVQFIILVISIPLMLVFGIHKLGGVSEFVAAVPETHLTMFHAGFTPWNWLALFLTFLIGETLVPPYVQRLLITKDAETTAKGTLYSALLSVPFFLITGMIGLVAYAIAPGIDANLSMPHLIQNVLPVGLRALVCAGVISIVMSSADSFLNSSAVCFMRDVFSPVVGPKTFSETATLRITQGVSLFVGIGATVLALSIDNVLDVLKFAYNFWAPVMLVPLLAILLGIRATKSSFVLGAICGSAVVVMGWVVDPAGGQILGMDALIFGTLANLIAFSLNHYIEKQTRAPA